jgi:hypothetical protein
VITATAFGLEHGRLIELADGFFAQAELVGIALFHNIVFKFLRFSQKREEKVAPPHQPPITQVYSLAIGILRFYQKVSAAHGFLSEGFITTAATAAKVAGAGLGRTTRRNTGNISGITATAIGLAHGRLVELTNGFFAQAKLA